MECIICYEPISKNELYIPNCGCKYNAHIECVTQWNGTCIICNAIPKPTLRRTIIDILKTLICGVMIVVCILVIAVIAIL